MPEMPVERLNSLIGWVKEMGIVILAASPDEVTCEWEVGEKHHQPYGIVHGGMHCGVITGCFNVARERAPPVGRGYEARSYRRAGPLYGSG